MENTILIDSNIIIDFFRKNQDTIKWFNENKNKIIFATTIINVFELYTGSYKAFDSEEKIYELENFLNTIKIFGFTQDSAKEAGKLRVDLEKQGQMIDMRDLFIGAIALAENISIKTNNKKHFSRIDGLKIVD
ncbi:MAG: type II toxin-antitoxin system VapC family toxin [Nanoarchaeota archaeon]